MTPFMLRVQQALEGRASERPATEASHELPVASAVDAHVQVRSLAEQLVAEANSVLVGHAAAISLTDLPDAGDLAFTLACGERSARVETVLNGRTALARVSAPGVADAEPRRLTDQTQVESLVLSLIAGQPHVPVH